MTNKIIKKHKILLGLTTTKGSNWKEKIAEINQFGIEEVALFPTFLRIEERKELYAFLEKTNLKKIPHVHLRDDMEDWELNLFFEKYGTRLFNIHPNQKSLDFVKKTKYKNIIFVENMKDLNDTYLEVLENCAGLCSDFSHWHDQEGRQKNKSYEKIYSLVEKYPIGCCHISAIDERPREVVSYLTGEKFLCYDNHTMSDFSQLDYIEKYVQYLPEYVSIELENSFKVQLEVKKYLEKIING
jgi:hypothetical protein